MVWGRIGKGAQENKMMVCEGGTGFYAPMAKSLYVSFERCHIYSLPQFLFGTLDVKGPVGKGWEITGGSC